MAITTTRQAKRARKLAYAIRYARVYAVHDAYTIMHDWPFDIFGSAGRGDKEAHRNQRVVDAYCTAFNRKFNELLERENG